MLQEVGSAARIVGMVHTPGEAKMMLASVLSWVFMIGLILLFAGESIFKSLKIEAGVKFVKSMQENQVVTIAILFACNFLSSNLVNTGAFEVYMNDELVFSKLQTGQLPDAKLLVQELARFTGGQ
jgi:selT/selW/selH-like putative selenoprotein